MCVISPEGAPPIRTVYVDPSGCVDGAVTKAVKNCLSGPREQSSGPRTVLSAPTDVGAASDPTINAAATPLDHDPMRNPSRPRRVGRTW
jgi:hypothetical protein